MDQTEQLEGHAVTAAEVYWERAGSSLAHQARGHGVPGRIGDLRLAHVPLRNFAGRKHGKRAALAQPFHRLLQGFHILIRRKRGAKWIHEDAMLVQIGDTIQQRVGQYFDVGTHAQQKHRQSRAVEHAKRMVGHGDQRAFNRNAIEVGGLDVELYLHFRQQCFQSKALRRQAHALIQFARLLHGNEFPGESGKPRQKRRFGQHTALFALFLSDRQFRHG